MRVHLCWVCSKAHPDMRSHSHNLALHLIQLWQRWKQPEQTWLCLPPWFCAIILFPLLVVIYWAFIKTEWARSQPGSINRPPPPRQTKVNSLSCVPFFLPSPSLRPSYLLLLFLLSFFSLPPPSLPPSDILFFSSPEKTEESYRSLISSWESAVRGPQPMWLCHLFRVGAS